MIQDQPTQWQADLAQEVFDEIMDAGPDYNNPIQRWDLASRLGRSQQEITIGMFWAHRLLAGPNQVHIGSRRGPGGGYYIALDEDEVNDSLVREWQERLNRALRQLGMVRGGGRLSDPAAQAWHIHTAENAVFEARMELVRLGADPGVITA